MLPKLLLMGMTQQYTEEASMRKQLTNMKSRALTLVNADQGRETPLKSHLDAVNYKFSSRLLILLVYNKPYSLCCYFNIIISISLISTFI